MTRKHITCPESAHLEVIDYEDTPFGIVVDRCSAHGSGLPECERECVRRLDRKARRYIDDRTERVLVLAACRDVCTRAIALRLVELLARDDLVVDFADPELGAAPPPEDYEAIVIGSAVHHGRQARSVVEYVARHHDALATMPAFMFGVERGVHVPLHAPNGWTPQFSVVFAAHSMPLSTADDAQLRAFALMIADELPAITPTARTG